MNNVYSFIMFIFITVLLQYFSAVNKPVAAKGAEESEEESDEESDEEDETPKTPNSQVNILSIIHNCFKLILFLFHRLNRSHL